MTPIKILVTNQKGGVGKSTISANLAAFFALKQGIKTAFIDFDKQSSSSNWLKKAANFGIEIHQAHLQSQNNSGLLLLDAKAALRECSKAAELVIADLTWTYTLPPQFLMEFDMVIVPSSISRVEMVSSEIFVLEYLQRSLAIAGKKHQIIIMAPSRIDAGQSTEGIFPFVSANGNCFISPPIEKVSDIDQYYFGSFLCEAQDERVAKNFCEFGSYIYEKYRALVMPYQSIHSGVSSSVSSYRQEQLKPPVLASGGQNSASASSTMPLKNERLGRKVVDLFIPQFLRTKSPIDNSKGE